MQVAVACICIICAATVIVTSKQDNNGNAQTNGNDGGEFYNMDNKGTEEPTNAFGEKISVKDLEGKDKQDIEDMLYPPSTITSNADKIDNDPASLYVLVNKENPVDQYYKPDDLVEPQVEFNFDKEDEKRYMREEAARALEGMFAQAEEEGYHLQAVSGYRSFLRQTILFKNNLKYHGLEYTSLYSAMPGKSEHQTGWAMDITCDSVDNVLSIDFGDCPEGQWVNDNCYKFGFIIRYPKNSEDITGYAYEPWHLRYVGYNLARYLRDNGITLDEYYGYVLNKEVTDANEIEYYEKNIGHISSETPDPEVILDIPDLEKDIPDVSKEPQASAKPDDGTGEDEPGDTQQPDKTATPDTSGKPDNSLKPVRPEAAQDPSKQSEKPEKTDGSKPAEPGNSNKPERTEKPDDPDKTNKPDGTDKPERTHKPEQTGISDSTNKPEDSTKPDTLKPDKTKPAETVKPDVTEGPESTTPAASATPAAGDQPTSEPAVSSKQEPTQPPKETVSPDSVKDPAAAGGQ